MSEYGRSLWYVTYEHGFVRRGLAGEVLRTIVGGRPTIATVDLVQNVVAVATVGAMVGAGRGARPAAHDRRLRGRRCTGRGAVRVRLGRRPAASGPARVPPPRAGRAVGRNACGRPHSGGARRRRTARGVHPRQRGGAARRRTVARAGGDRRLPGPVRRDGPGRDPDRAVPRAVGDGAGRADAARATERAAGGRPRARRTEHHRGPRFGVRVPRRHVRFELPTGHRALQPGAQHRGGDRRWSRCSSQCSAGRSRT